MEIIGLYCLLQSSLLLVLQILNINCFFLLLATPHHGIFHNFKDVWDLCLLFCCFFAASSFGARYFVAIPPYLFQEERVIHLIISTLSSDPEVYSITSDTGPVNISGVVTKASPAVEELPLELEVANPTERNKGIEVTATAPISVYVTFLSTVFTGDYLAYPCQAFPEAQTQYEYYAITSGKSGSTYVLLVACDDDTTVRVTASQSIQVPINTQSTTSDLVAIEVGQTVTLPLSGKQTLLLLNDDGLDIGGTKITSNKPLTVITGNLCSKVPESVGFCEPLYIQVPPVFTWGNRFLVTPFAGRTGGQSFRVTTAEDNTDVSFKCGNASAILTRRPSAGSSYSVQYSSSQYCYIFSNKRVLVVQLAYGGAVGTGGDGMGDPAMAIVSPIQEYSSSALFVSLGLESDFISITVPVTSFRPLGIFFDGLPLNCEWKDILGFKNELVGAGCTFEVVSAGSHSVEHIDNGGRISVLAYGFLSYINNVLHGYAYQASLSLEVLTVDGKSVVAHTKI